MATERGLTLLATGRIHPADLLRRARGLYLQVTTGEGVPAAPLPGEDFLPDWCLGAALRRIVVEDEAVRNGIDLDRMAGTVVAASWWHAAYEETRSGQFARRMREDRALHADLIAHEEAAGLDADWLALDERKRRGPA